MKDKVASKFAYTGVIFFIAGSVILILTDSTDNYEGSPPINMTLLALFGLIFHLAMLPVIAALPSPSWAKASGFAWVVTDNILVMLAFSGHGGDINLPLRWGVHIALATWIFGASWVQSGTFRWIGLLAAIALVGASLGGPFAGEAAENLLIPSGLFLVAWIIMAGARLAKSDAITQ
jgi:hypothetical protein